MLGSVGIKLRCNQGCNKGILLKIMLGWCCLLLKWTYENVNDTFLFRIRFAGLFKLSGFLRLLRSPAFIGGHVHLLRISQSLMPG